ncbi:MAG: asparagine synthase (glutamine-hydrolyzing) [Clostridium sp.]
MCGFLSLFKKDITDIDIAKLKMGAKEISHRGPDDTRIIRHTNGAFAFNRLSIVDLEHGGQPYTYREKYTVVFNGEIYNHNELREELKEKGYSFETDSEVEVIGSLYDLYKEELVHKLRGMFAIVIYDIEMNKITAIRDFFGIKPLYYMEDRGALYFASEIKGLKKINSLVNYRKDLLGEYATFQYIPSNKETIFKEIFSIEPGHMLVKEIDRRMTIKKYFNVNFEEKKWDKEQLKKSIKETLKESIGLHLNSDVPVATFLSGGIDSSIITKVARDINPNIVSYTVGFDVEGYDETENAKRFAKDIGIENRNVKLTCEDYIRDLPEIIYYMDSPIADPSIIPLYFICKKVSEDYKVILSGEGSDEFFGGYNIYTEDNSLKAFNYMPSGIKSIIKGFAKKLPDNTKGKSFLLRGTTELKDRYCGNANIFNEEEKDKVFNRIDKNDLKITKRLFDNVKGYDNVVKRQYIDINTWLVGDILAKADRISMAHSLEVRVPFVDKEVFKLARTLSKEDKVQEFKTKVMLREAFKDELPEYLYEKRKLGYPVPIRVWLKDELYNWAYEIIENNPIEEINEKEVLKMLKKHKEGNGDYSRKVWSVIVYIIWYRLYVEKSLSKDFKFELELVHNELVAMGQI